jgi:hypothetical protein
LENETFTTRTLNEYCKNTKTLPTSGFLVDNNKDGTSEDGLRWFSYDKNSIEDLGLLVCERYPGFRLFDGAVYDLSRRYSVLTSCIGVYRNEGKGPSFLKHILDVQRSNPNLFESAIEAVKVFWQCDPNVGKFMNGNPSFASLYNLPSLSNDRSAVSESALAVVSMLYCLVSSFNSVQLLPPSDLEAIIDGCLLSPLFAEQTLHSNPIIDSSVKDMDKKLRSYHDAFDKALNTTKGSLSDALVGTRRHIRWVEVIKIIMKEIILPLVPSNESNLYTHWFDGYGILTAIRLNSIPSKNPQEGMKVLPYGDDAECGEVAKLLKLTFPRAVNLSKALLIAKAALHAFLLPIISKPTFHLDN